MNQTFESSKLQLDYLASRQAKETETGIVDNSIEDYALLLEKYTKEYTIDQWYLNVGKPQNSQGWILHVSIIPSQVECLISQVLPALIASKLPFKMVKNKEIHRQVNGGKLGKYKVGKNITIYLENELIILQIVENLVKLTDGLTGPVVYSDFPLKNNIYTRYGSYYSILEKDAFGNILRIIKDGNGELILDKYFNPPIIPANIENPFQSFVDKMEKPPKLFLFHNKYLPVKQLKSDLKGNVYKCLYFNKYLAPKWCIIKQGTKGMFPDDFGRDARNRIQWQDELHALLKGNIRIPSKIDFFEDNSCASLVLEYVKNGLPLAHVIKKELNGTPWFTQPVKSRVKILKYLEQILDSIDLVHKRGFVHRDITGTNFLVDRNNKVWLIDLELMYSSAANKPCPPFEVGTNGYMSPEQESGQLPTVYDDIYSLGALMAMIFTGGLEPAAFIEHNKSNLSEKLSHLIGDITLSNLVNKCLSTDILSRPTINELREEFSYSIKGNLKHERKAPSTLKFDKSEITCTISQCIKAISGKLMTNQNLWYSHIDNEYGPDVYPMINKHTFTGLYSGVGGVIWALTQAKRTGFRVDEAEQNISAGIKYISEELNTFFDGMTSSLYYGKSGLAVVFASCIQAGILPKTDHYEFLIQKCLDQTAPTLDIIFGISGLGLGALACKRYLNEAWLRNYLEQHVHALKGAQQKDGSWITFAGSEQRQEKTNGFGYGIAGICYFLLKIGALYKHQEAISVAEKGLAFLKKQIIRHKGRPQWQDSNISKTSSIWWCRGNSGISLSYIKAYEVTGDQEYLSIAECTMRAIPKYFTTTSLGQCHGLSGLGEIYLEAFRSTSNEEWFERASWIAKTLISLRRNHLDDTYWLSENLTLPTADFMTGNAGILHFLMRYTNPDCLNFPVIDNLIQ